MPPRSRAPCTAVARACRRDCCESSAKTEGIVSFTIECDVP